MVYSTKLIKAGAVALAACSQSAEALRLKHHASVGAEQVDLSTTTDVAFMEDDLYNGNIGNMNRMRKPTGRNPDIYDCALEPMDNMNFQGLRSAEEFNQQQLQKMLQQLHQPLQQQPQPADRLRAALAELDHLGAFKTAEGTNDGHFLTNLRDGRAVSVDRKCICIGRVDYADSEDDHYEEYTYGGNFTYITPEDCEALLSAIQVWKKEKLEARLLGHSQTAPTTTK